MWWPRSISERDRRRVLDLRLLHASTGSTATPDSVIARGDMRDMPHAAFRQQANALGGGMYRLDLPLEMPRVWDVKIQIVDGPAKAEVRLSIGVPE
jgi:hypothetical protein